MSLRICFGLFSVVLLSSMGAACGGDDVTPPLDADAATSDLGGADAGPRDAAFDANTIDAAECPDVDGDGYRAAPCGDDCDDDDASRYPGATEICDGDDEDCDDTTHAADADGDTFVSVACCNGAGNCGTDCDDAAVNINPSGTEVCNGGIDDDCNGQADTLDGVCVPCATGYTGFDGECSDIDECMAGAPCGAASGTTCENTVGAYGCYCPSGYTAPAAGGTCVDVNECDLGTCGGGMATCVNSVGSYACTCNAGYTVVPGGGAPCVDVDECAAGTPCGAGLGTCENRAGIHACTCIAGYEAPAVGGTCADIDECTRGTDDCESTVGMCANAVGTFTCTCPAGYSGTGRGAGGCTDVDDCAAGTPCGAGLGACANRVGTYACTCSTGYEAPATGGTCVDVNECAAGTHDCDTSPLAVCTNTVASFTCACPAGVGGAGHGTEGCSGPRFTDLGGGLVRDNNGSGLVWQQTVSASTYTQAGAIAYCAGLALDGGGWRLPTKDELLSIVDTSFYPSTDPTYFPGTPVAWFWSSSSPAGSPSAGWAVNFFGGGGTYYVATNNFRARCVR